MSLVLGLGLQVAELGLDVLGLEPIGDLLDQLVDAGLGPGKTSTAITGP